MYLWLEAKRSRMKNIVIFGSVLGTLECVQEYADYL